MDKETRDVLPVRLTKFYLFLLGVGIAHNPTSKLVLNLLFYNAISSLSIGFVISVMDVYYSWGEFYGSCHSLIAFIMWFIIATKFYTVAMQYEAFIQLIIDGKKFLWNGKHFSQYEKNVLEGCERRSMAFITCFVLVTQCTALAYICEPLIENRSRNESNRLLPFNMWYKGVLFSISPYYEMAFAMQVVNFIFLSFSYFAFDNFLALANLFISGQFTILSHRLETLFDNGSLNVHLHPYSEYSENSKIHYRINQLRREFIGCVKHHQLIISLTNNVESVYSLLNLVQTVTFSLLVCLIGYQLISPGIHPSRRFKFTSSLIGCIIQLFTFAHTCNHVTTASSAVGEGIYYSKWYETNLVDGGRRLAKDLMLVLMRTQRPCYLTALGFFPITHDTFKSILSTAFSYLTLMRQNGGTTL